MGSLTMEEKYRFFKCPYCAQYHENEVTLCEETGRFLYPAHKFLCKYIDEGILVHSFSGESEMCVTYECEHLPTERVYSVRFLKFDLSMLYEARDSFERFKRESRATEFIAHPNIADVHKIGATQLGVPFLIMEPLRGSDLGDILSKWGRVPLGDAGDIMAQVLGGLGAAHNHGIVHASLRPECVFMAVQAGGPAVVKLLDFGVERISSSIHSYMETSQPGFSPAIPYYISPEQAQGNKNIDHRADLFSAGVLFYQLVTGYLPFIAKTYGRQLLEIITSELPDPRDFIPGLPAPIVEFLSIALAKDPAERFQSAEDMLRELKALDTGAAGRLRIERLVEEPERITERIKTPIVEVGSAKHKDFSSTGRKPIPSWIGKKVPKKKDTPPEGQKPQKRHEAIKTPSPFAN